MTPNASPHVSHEEPVALLTKTLHSEAVLSPERAGLREFAHRKFMPAIERAKHDDDAQDTFTSSARNLGVAGWMLTDLALRVADLADTRK